MNARAVIDFLFERQELGQIASLERQAREMLADVQAHWEKLYAEAFLGDPIKGRSKAVQAKRARLASTDTWSLVGTHGVILDLGTDESVNGAFTDKGESLHIRLNSPAFEIADLATMARIRPNNPNHKDNIWIMRQAREYLARSLSALKRADVVQTLIHELTHEKDNYRYPLGPHMDKRNARLVAINRKSKDGVSADLRRRNEFYMGSTHEYNAYTTHALHTALSKNCNSWEQFKRAFLEAYGSNHWGLTPPENQRKATQRAYAAFTQQKQQHGPAF